MNNSTSYQESDGKESVSVSNHDTFSLPFDEFQRYKIVADIINLYRENNGKFTILDVGSGARRSLNKFLPTDDITFLDKEIPPNYQGKDIIVGDITCIEISQKYDFIVSIDTLEHISSDHRENFIQKILDCSKLATIIAAPFNTSGVGESELIINDLYKSVFNVDYPWLKEHIQNGLPNLKETLAFINRNPMDITVIPNGYLTRWSNLLSFFLLNDSPLFTDVFQDLFSFYNQHFYQYDNQEPAYRHVIVVNKTNKKIEFEQIISKTPDTNELKRLSLILESLISTIKNGIERAFIKEREKYLKEREDLKILVYEKDREIQSMNKDIEILQEINLKHQKSINEIKKSISWTCVNKIQCTLECLFPTGSILSRIYHQSIKKIQTIFQNFSGNPPNKKIKVSITKDTTIRHNIFCFSIIDWNYRYQRPQHLLSRLAKKGYRIFYFPVTQVQESDLYSLKRIDDNIFEVNISILNKITIYSDYFYNLQIEKFMKGIDQLIIDGAINQPICFVEFPAWEPVVAKIREKYQGFVIFDCLDEYSGFSNVDSSITNFERKLSEISDFVIATSQYLKEKCEKYKKNVIFLPNASDFEHFSFLPSNDYLENLNRPIIGYYGAIAEWFNLELLEYLASNRPEWNFVLIGHTYAHSISCLEKYKNIHLLGEKSYQELPKYLYWFDVCLIPFIDSPLIKATHPVKFYEYLSSGKPVVSSKLPELIQYQDLCYLATDKEDYLQKIEIALNENNPKIRLMRIEFAKTNTWDVRVEELLKLMNILKSRK